jgi:hypothetical protein
MYMCCTGNVQHYTFGVQHEFNAFHESHAHATTKYNRQAQGIYEFCMNNANTLKLTLLIQIKYYMYVSHNMHR